MFITTCKQNLNLATIRAGKAFQELQGKICYISTKNDGASFKASYKDGAFQIFSRRLELVNDGSNTWSFAAQKYDLENKLKSLGRNLCLCGELCGPKLNGNKMGLKEVELYIYDIWDINNQKYFDYVEMATLIKELDVPYVGLWKFPLDIFTYSVESLQNEIGNCKYLNGEWIEGVVIRPIEETYSPALKGRLSLKLINTNFAAKHL